MAIVKPNQRLGYQRLAEVLVERNVVDSDAVRAALHQSSGNGQAFPEALVGANLVADWELSRLVCELFSLPFLTVDMVDPDPEAANGLDLAFLAEHRLVPLCRNGGSLTVAMPGLVPADVLGILAAETNLHVFPVVGTVRTNRRWVDDKLLPRLAGAQEAATPAVPEAQQVAEAAEQAIDAADWSSLFDEADAQVLMELDLHGDEGEDGGLTLSEPRKPGGPAAPAAEPEDLLELDFDAVDPGKPNGSDEAA